MSPSPETTYAETDLEMRLRRTVGRARTSTSLTDGCSVVLFTAGPKVCELAGSRIISFMIQRDEAQTAKDFSMVHQLSNVPWSAPAGERRILGVDEEMQSKKKCSESVSSQS